MNNESGNDTRTTKEKRLSSPLLNVGLIAIGGMWLAILLRKQETKVERWIAAILLCIVGITGLFRIGTGKSVPKDAEPMEPGSGEH